MSIYAIAAAKPEESAYATYCYPDDIVNDTHIGACLSDVFTANWLETENNKNYLKESLDN